MFVSHFANLVVLMRGLIVGLTLIVFNSSTSFAQPWGKEDAPITIMVFSAFTCPYCAEAKKQIDQIKAKYPNDVRIVFKHFPLSDSAEAKRPHLIAAAAQAQGKFWQVHDIVFARPETKSDIELIGAVSVAATGVDAAKLRAALADGSASERLAADSADAQALKVRATPTFFIDGLRLEGLQEMSTFTNIIDFKRGGALTAAVPTSASSAIKGTASSPR